MKPIYYILIALILGALITWYFMKDTVKPSCSACSKGAAKQKFITECINKKSISFEGIAPTLIASEEQNRADCETQWNKLQSNQPV